MAPKWFDHWTTWAGLFSPVHKRAAIVIESRATFVQAERELGDEEAGDRQLRAQFGPLWSRTPSEVLSAPIRHELARYRSIISNAISSDGMMRQRFSSHRNAIALLSQSDVRASVCRDLAVHC